MTFGRLTPGVRILALKNALGGVAAIVAAAESSSERTYGQRLARGRRSRAPSRRRY